MRRPRIEVNAQQTRAFAAQKIILGLLPALVVVLSGMLLLYSNLLREVEALTALSSVKESVVATSEDLKKVLDTLVADTLNHVRGAASEDVTSLEQKLLDLDALYSSYVEQAAHEALSPTLKSDVDSFVALLRSLWKLQQERSQLRQLVFSNVDQARGALADLAETKTMTSDLIRIEADVATLTTHLFASFAVQPQLAVSTAALSHESVVQHIKDLEGRLETPGQRASFQTLATAVTFLSEQVSPLTTLNEGLSRGVVHLVEEQQSLRHLLDMSTQNYKVTDLEAATRHTQDSLKQLVVMLLVTVIVFLCVAGAGWLWIYRLINQPLQMLTHRAKRVAEGDFTVRFSTDRKDEFGSLARSLNDMVTSLVTTQAKLSESLQQEEIARQQAQSASRAKSEFLSRMSHELRTPLNAVLGFAQLLELDNLTPKQHKRVHHILHGGKHLLGLIEETLDMTRIEAGRFNLHFSSVNIVQLIRECLELLYPLAEQKQLSIFFDSSHLQQDLVKADAQRLKQVLLNLISNAIKYNVSGGSIWISLESEGKTHLKTTIRDSGLGLNEEQLGKLFRPFERVGAEGLEVEGMGLGLALSKVIIEKHGGTIGVLSKPGEGSSFYFLLETPALPANTPWNFQLLAIDDSPGFLKLLQVALAPLEVEVLTAATAREGLSLSFAHRPRLILLDLDLPDLSGESVLQHLKRKGETRDIPVVVISASTQSERRTRLLELGASHYLEKPLDMNRLRQLVQDHVDGIMTPPSFEELSARR